MTIEIEGPVERLERFTLDLMIMAQKAGQERIVLSGGCFRNSYLIEGFIHHLYQEGFTAYWHRNIPPNDGGIAFGQAVFRI